MKILDQIQNDLTDSEKNLSDILRKAKFCVTSQNDEMKSWVERELNGYFKLDKSEIPDYRISQAQNYGHFSGPFNSKLRNANIPTNNLPEEIKNAYEDLVIRQGIGELQSIVDEGEKSMKNKWSAEVIAYMQHNVTVYEGMRIVDAWQHVSMNGVTRVLDSVRNRLLDFILELKEDFPEQTSKEDDLKEIPTEAGK